MPSLMPSSVLAKHDCGFLCEIAAWGKTCGASGPSVVSAQSTRAAQAIANHHGAPETALRNAGCGGSVSVQPHRKGST